MDMDTNIALNRSLAHTDTWDSFLSFPPSEPTDTEPKGDRELRKRSHPRA